MDNKPFDIYQFEVDDEAEEVLVEAFDADSPVDIWRARLSYEELASLLWKVHRALRRS